MVDGTVRDQRDRRHVGERKWMVAIAVEVIKGTLEVVTGDDKRFGRIGILGSTPNPVGDPPGVVIATRTCPGQRDGCRAVPAG